MSTTRPARSVQAPSPAAAALRSYCQDTGTSMRALSLAIGRGPKYVADICGGRSRYPDVAGLRALAAHTGLPLTLLTGREETVAASSNAALAPTVRAGLYMTDVLAAVRDDDTLAAGTRDKRIRNIHVFCCDWMKRDPGAVPADARWLSNRMRDQGTGHQTETMDRCAVERPLRAGDGPRDPAPDQADHERERRLAGAVRHHR